MTNTRHDAYNEDSSNDLATELDELSDFWKALDRAMKLTPTVNGIEDVFSEYLHLTTLIEADAEQNEEHGKMLTQALAIRNAT
jgi:chromatin segregation and condensation protein Rec8/ScpA/Scc1 (kleisin family)